MRQWKLTCGAWTGKDILIDRNSADKVCTLQSLCLAWKWWKHLIWAKIWRHFSWFLVRSSVDPHFGPRRKGRKQHYITLFRVKKWCWTLHLHSRSICQPGTLFVEMTHHNFFKTQSPGCSLSKNVHKTSNLKPFGTTKFPAQKTILQKRNKANWELQAVIGLPHRKVTLCIRNKIYFIFSVWRWSSLSATKKQDAVDLAGKPLQDTSHLWGMELGSWICTRSIRDKNWNLRGGRRFGKRPCLKVDQSTQLNQKEETNNSLVMYQNSTPCKGSRRSGISQWPPEQTRPLG